MAASSVEGKQNVRPQIARSPISGKEFDPLSTQLASRVDESAQSKVLSSFGLAADGQFFFIFLFLICKEFRIFYLFLFAPTVFFSSQPKQYFQHLLFVEAIFLLKVCSIFSSINCRVTYLQVLGVDLPKHLYFIIVKEFLDFIQ